ncbi:MAG: L-2-amino-thiazoline-4-carboxylic acid hydrolase [bacterium]|nr:L-2-amino-thiazoline-4-carboxylic acid hydrolase [bacterium]
MSQEYKQRMIKDMCKMIKRDYPERAEHIIHQAATEYKRICRENPNESRKVAMHTREKIYPAIAFYKAVLAETKDQDVAYHLIADYYARYAEDTGRVIRALAKFPGAYKLIPNIMSRIICGTFGVESGFQMTIQSREKSRCHIDMTTCPYNENCKKYGCPELTTAFCNSDDISYGNMHPKLHWGRTKTLGRGNEVCDFILEFTEPVD